MQPKVSWVRLWGQDTIQINLGGDQFAHVTASEALELIQGLQRVLITPPHPMPDNESGND